MPMKTNFIKCPKNFKVSLRYISDDDVSSGHYSFHKK